MKKFLLIISAIGAFSALSSTATAGDTYYRLVGYDNCGHPVYACYHVHGYDSCGRVVGQWTTPVTNYASVVNPGPMYRLVDSEGYPYSYADADSYNKPQPPPNSPNTGWNFQARQ